MQTMLTSDVKSMDDNIYKNLAFLSPTPLIVVDTANDLVDFVNLSFSSVFGNVGASKNVSHVFEPLVSSLDLQKVFEATQVISSTCLNELSITTLAGITSFWNIHVQRLSDTMLFMQFLMASSSSTQQQAAEERNYNHDDPTTTNKKTFGNTFLDDHEAVVDFLENSPRPVHVLNRDFDFVWANKCELDILGYTKEELFGQSIRTVLPNPDAVLKDSRSTFAQGENVEKYVPFRKKDGSTVFMKVSANLRYLDESGSNWTTRSFLSDDTEVITLENERQRRLQLAEEILDLKRSFVRYVSHEIRSPLNVLCGLLEMMQLDEWIASSSPEHVRELLTDMSVSSTQAIDILNDLLNYENLTSGTFNLKQKMVRLRDWAVIEESGALINMAKSRHVNLSFANNIADLMLSIHDDDLPEKDELMLNIDSFRITQVLRNLVVNSIKFTPAGGSITIRFRLNNDDAAAAMAEVAAVAEHQVQNYLWVDVIDTGSGISLENQSRVFQQFEQFSRTILQSCNEGSGLGLWITNKIISLHGGNVRCSSQGEGFGTTFSFSLPLFRLPDKEQEIATEHSTEKKKKKKRKEEKKQQQAPRFVTTLPPPPLPSEDFHNTKVLNVLVVDDSAMNRKVVKQMLLKLRHQFDLLLLEADDGQSALQIIAEQREIGVNFDCIFLDSVMKVLHGPEAAKIMRQDFSYIGIIFSVTGNALPADIEECKRCGVNDVLIKPLKFEDLTRLLQKYGFLSG